MKLAVSITLGIAIGVLTSRYLFVSSALGLIPWSLAGLALGIWAVSRRQACLLGALYGFFLLFSFMFGGYSGTASETSRIIPFAILGLGGAAGGTVLTSVGFLVRSAVRISDK